MTKVKQLINNFTPSHYNIFINLNEKNDSFSGLVDIEGVVHEKDLIFHSKDLSIKNVNVNGKKAEFLLRDDELIIVSPESTTENLIVTISFDGKITDAMHGLYPSYFQHDGKAKKIYATQFESHHAREMFPCIDEPSAKATFDLTVETAPDITVLSNQPVKWQRFENGRLLTNFETTPLMSTYLLALAAGEMIKKTGKTKDNVDVTVYASAAQNTDDLSFALENSIKFIEFYDDFFGTPYPLAKSDQLALPDFSSGAMENWGLITYRESVLLANDNTDIHSRQQIAKTIAHELSHQWFGNLVTMKWWNDLWLNESFANMMEYLAVDVVHPDWHIWQDYASTEVPYSLNRDSLDGVQSVQTDVNHPDEINTLFDGAIVYAKGGHLLYMVRKYIGDEAFRKGLQNYFKKYAYQNTIGDDLWTELSATSGKDIKNLMNQWIKQPGFPIVEAKMINGDIKLSQKQFFVGEHKKSHRLWDIPLDTNDPNAPTLMTADQLTFVKSPGLFLANQNNASHFITHYSPDLRQQILDAIKNGQVSDDYKIQFLNESMLLSQSYFITQSDLIDTLAVFSNEKNEQVWSIVAGLLASLRKFVLDNPSAEKALKSLSYEIAKNEYQRLGFAAKDSETENDTKLRGTILSLVLYSDNAEAITMANELAKQPLENMDPEIRSLIISSAVKNSTTDKLFDKFLNLYPEATDPALRDDLMIALTATKNEKNIKLLLAKLTDRKFVRPQDIAFWFVQLLRNKYATTIAWHWLRQNWQWIEITFKGDKSYDEYVRYATIGLYTAKHLSEYNDFFDPKKSDPSLTRVIELGEISLAAKVKLIEDNKDIVAEKLFSL